MVRITPDGSGLLQIASDGPPQSDGNPSLCWHAGSDWFGHLDAEGIPPSTVCHFTGPVTSGLRLRLVHQSAPKGTEIHQNRNFALPKLYLFFTACRLPPGHTFHPHVFGGRYPVNGTRPESDGAAE